MGLRVWWVTVPNGEVFLMDVPTVEAAILLLKALANYDQHLIESGLLDTPVNSGGLEMLTDTDGWISWEDEETGITDPLEYEEYLRDKALPKE